MLETSVYSEKGQKIPANLCGDDGDLQLLTLNSETLVETDVYFSYYSSNTKDPHTSGYRLVFNESGGYMYVILRDNATRFIVINKIDPVSSRDFYHRAILHFDGVFSQYYHPKRQGNNSNGWLLAWAEPENICQKNFGPYLDANEFGILACGFNNVCILGDNQRPRCECPKRFLLVDPNDEYGDCKPGFQIQTCGPENNQTATAKADVNLYKFIRLNATNWPSGDYQRYYNVSVKLPASMTVFVQQWCWGKDRLYMLEKEVSIVLWHQI